ncbi:hypothetical protein PAXINDRAFT_115792 [Paxillus involutus ATCC 200175]|uniref:Uncharacterized protein n=1 Tax=Paxillus involutus ATCC 200175 TaxID=664439 RepID=A0A0C9TFQ8_PAXIN|nr:hypothetical protein PAXINDRAFT_115792 [Paxillus involutus ATCC 200175]
MLSRQQYQGLSRKLILAFDVGTTYSGVSYCILDPGEIPKIHGVSRYPAQEHVGGDNKIPSILYYDRQGTVQAVGAEALQQHVIEQAEEERWIKLEWWEFFYLLTATRWKLHLRAKHLASSHIKDDDIPSLPEGKSAVQVLADFMQYLLTCARSYIIESRVNGANIWRSVEDGIEFILTHPNGWEGPQQQQIRRAAQLAGLVPNEEGQARIHLLTEGEASLHFCVTHILASDSLSPNGVVIIDAGGGTVDLSAYSMKLSPPTSFEEIAPAECRLQGSVFVTHRAHAFLKAKLANSRFGAPDIVQQMKDEFDKTTKLRFRDAEEPQYIKFGTVRDKEPEYNIRSGQLKLAGEDVADFFRPSVEAIAEAFEQQKKATTMRIKYAFLVGGYAASDFLYASLCQHPVFSDVNLSRPGDHVNKAVADGGVSFYIDHLVSSRAARFTYGVNCTTGYKHQNSEHNARRATAFRSLSGRLVLPNAFQSILTKGTHVSEEQEFRHTFYMKRESPSDCSHVSSRISNYRGELTAPAWVDVEPHAFATLCTVHANTSKIIGSLRPRRSEDSSTGVYYTIDYDVILLFGLTELKAQISWKENVCCYEFNERIITDMCNNPSGR